LANCRSRGCRRSTFQYIGESGTGTFTQDGGTNTIPQFTLVPGSGGFYLGYNSGASGSYNLKSGSLSTEGESIGNSGTGIFTQTGGTNTASDYLYLGYWGGSGSYTLSGSGSLSAPTQYIGYKGTGTFSQTGGTNTGDILLATNPGASGTYNLSGGSLSSGLEYIGSLGTGTFTQTGGTNTISDSLYMGWASGNSGSYALSGGSLSAPNQYIGYLGTGTFNQTGGSNIYNSHLYVGYDSGASGTTSRLAAEAVGKVICVRMISCLGS
jgi:hypothetical protein